MLLRYPYYILIKHLLSLNMETEPTVCFWESVCILERMTLCSFFSFLCCSMTLLLGVSHVPIALLIFGCLFLAYFTSIHHGCKYYQKKTSSSSHMHARCCCFSSCLLQVFKFFQNVLTCTWCPPRTWTSMGSAPCRSPMKTSTCGTFTTLASNSSCGLSAPCADTAEIPPGSRLSLEGVCVRVCVDAHIACLSCVCVCVWLNWQQ